MCCGQKRSELRNSPTREAARSVPQPVSSNSQAQVARSRAARPLATQKYAQPALASSQRQTTQQRTVAPMRPRRLG